MPRDSSGNYTRDNGLFQGGSTWAQTAATDPTIRSARHDVHDNDIGDEITNSLDRDGKGGMRSNLQMGGNRITDIGTPTLATDALRLGDVSRIAPAEAERSLSAAGVSDDYTISSDARRITGFLRQTGTSGTDLLMIQIGNGGVQTSGYIGSMTSAAWSNGMILALASSGIQGAFQLDLQSATLNRWMLHSVMAYSSSANVFSAAGFIELGAGSPINTIRLTTTGGIDTFNFGSWSIRVET